MYVSNSSVTLKVKLLSRPAVDEFRRMTYVVQFRKYGSAMWIGLWHIRCQIETITGLEQDTLYSFGVAAKYQGGDYGPFSQTINVKTELAVTVSVILCLY